MRKFLVAGRSARAPFRSMKTPAEFNHRMNQKRPEGYKALRVWAIPATKKKSPRLRIKCGCCDQKVVIYYGEGENADSLEINGVFGSVENWREILLPLLECPPPDTKHPAKKTVPKKKQAQ